MASAFDAIQGCSAAYAKAVRDPGLAQGELLSKILDYNKETRVSQDLKLNGMSGSDFRTACPIRTYADVRPYVKTIMQSNEPYTMTADPVEFLATSTGTSGEIKYFPYSRSFLEYASRSFFGSIGYFMSAVGSRDPGLLRGLPIMTLKADEYSNSGLPCGGGSRVDHYYNGERMEWQGAPLVPSACCRAYGERLEYLSWLFALGHADIRFISTVYPLSMIMAFETFRRHQDQLISDLETGVLSEILAFEPDIRAAAQRALMPKPDRASAVRAAMRGKDFPDLRAIWSGFTCLVTCQGGPFRHYLRVLRENFPDVPIFNASYGAAEGWGALGLGPREEMVPALETTFLEFIPETEADRPQPETLLVSELEQDHIYETVFTTIGGLYRYRMGDLVQVAGKLEKTPLIVCLGRRGVCLNAVDEKNTEQDILEVAGMTLKILNFRASAFAVGLDQSRLPPNYQFVIEAHTASGSEMFSESQLSKTFDSAMKQHNFLYEAKRANGAIGDVSAYIVPRGTLRDYFVARLRGPASPNQIKVPHVVQEAEFWSHIRNVSVAVSKGG